MKDTLIVSCFVKKNEKCFVNISFHVRMIFLLHSTAPQPPPTHPTHHEHPEKAPSARPSSCVSCSSSAARPSSPPLPPPRATTTGYAMYVWTRDHAISSTPNAAHCKTACIPSTTMVRRTLSASFSESSMAAYPNRFNADWRDGRYLLRRCRREQRTLRRLSRPCDATTHENTVNVVARQDHFWTNSSSQYTQTPHRCLYTFRVSWNCECCSCSAK